jgi:uncharacterized protein (TIGR00369 family)
MLPTMSNREKLQAMVDRSHFGRWWGLMVESVDPDPVRVRVPARTELLRPGDVLHGACAMIAADVAVWVALCGRISNGEGALTVHLATDYLAPARSDIIAEARLLKVGKRLAFASAETRTVDGTLVAVHQITYALP